MKTSAKHFGLSIGP